MPQRPMISSASAMLAIFAMFHFSLAHGLHKLNHTQKSAAPSHCDHAGCNSEKLPLENSNSSESDNCEICDVLATAYGELLHVQILLTVPAFKTFQVSYKDSQINSWVNKERPGRSPPNA